MVTNPRAHSMGKWRVLGLIGSGSFGSVYEAEHESIPGCIAAVKVLRPEISLDKDMKRRFINEASAASRAKHENIIQIFDAGTNEDGLCYVAMERLHGRSLASTLKNDGAISVERTLNIAIQVTAALACVHAQGIIHRDLKPDNIFLIARAQNPEFVKILDFGIAKLQGDGSGTGTGTWLGTPAYMSPEQWQAMPDIDGRSDLYALGMILFRCLTGKMPFAASTPFGWMQAHMTQPIPEVTGIGAPALAALVRSLLAKDRAARPQRADDVLLALCRLAGPTAERSHRQPWTPRGARSRRLLAVIGVSLAGLVAALESISSMPGCHQDDPPELRPPGPGASAQRHLPARSFPPPPASPASPPARPLPAELVLFGPGRLRPLRRPDVEVAIARFALSRCEVSMAQYREYAEAQGLRTALPWDGVEDFSAIAAYPVNLISRHQAERYCRWRYPGGRLPTEAEWEFAARSGGHDLYPWGAAPPTRERVNAGATRPALISVRDLPDGASPDGLLHLLGNVAEWTAGDADAQADGNPARLAVARGGSAESRLRRVSIAARTILDAARPYPFVGLRCAASSQEEP